MGTLKSFEASSNEDLPELSPRFHELAGAAAMMGATRLAEIARECETTLSQEATPTDDLKLNLRDAVESTKAEFKKLQMHFGG